MNCAIIVQPQTKPFKPELGETSEPNQQLAPLGDTTLIQFMARRLKAQCPEMPVIFAISEEEAWNPVARELENESGVIIERIPDTNRLAGFLDISEKHNLDVIARITGDVPFHDGDVIRGMFAMLEKEELDLVDNGRAPQPHPIGLDVITYGAMCEAANSLVLLPYDKLHIVVHTREFADKTYAQEMKESATRVGYFNLEGVKYENPKNLVSATPEHMKINNQVVANLLAAGLDPYTANLDQVMRAAGAISIQVPQGAGLQAPATAAPHGFTRQLQDQNRAARLALLRKGPELGGM